MKKLINLRKVKRVNAFVLAIIIMLMSIPFETKAYANEQDPGNSGNSSGTQNDSEVTLTVNKLPQTEIALAVGNTKINYGSFAADLAAALKDQGIKENVSFVEVDANAAASKDNFTWWTYDHAYNTSIVNNDSHNFIENTQSNTQYTGNPYNNISRHIVTTNSGKTMDFYGYGSSGYKDFNFMPNEQATKKTIEFTINEGAAYDALDGIGFLFNTSITGTYSGNQKINGYLLFLGYNTSGVGQSIKLFKLTDVNAYNLHHNMKSNTFGAGNIEGATLLATATTSYGDFDYRKVSIEVMPEYIKIWYNGSQQNNTGITFSDNDLVTWPTYGTTYPLSTVYDTVNGVEVYRGGYGPLISYRSHNCASPTHFTLSNLKMEAAYVRSITEVIREPNWDDEKVSFLVNLNEAVINDFSDVYSTAELVNRLADDDITYIGWCGNKNIAASQTFVDNLSEGSVLVNMNDTELYGSNPYSTESYNKQIETIAKAIANKMQKQVGTNEIHTYLNTEEFSFTSVGSSLADGNWSVGYSTNSFADAKLTTNISTYQNLENASFTTCGYYEVYYQGDTDNPKAKIRIHQAPVASFFATINTTTGISVTDKSYDIEFCENIAEATGAIADGIATKKFEYKNLTKKDIDWTTTRPTAVTAGDTWLVRLTVTDADGAQNSQIQQLSTASTQVAPYGTFRLSSTQYMKSIDTYVSISDQSYALDGSTNFTVSYILKNSSGVQIWQSSTAIGNVNYFAPGSTYNYPLNSLSEGTYTLSMTASKNGKTSETVKRTFTVAQAYKVEYNGGTTANTVPSEQYKIKDVSLTLSTVAPTKTGYNFTNWSTNSDGSGTVYNPGDDYSINQAVVLYANWIPVKYTTTFHGTNVIGDDSFGVQKAVYDQTWTGQLIPDIGYLFPSTITVTIAGTPISEELYSYNSSNGKIEIDEALVTGNIMISAVSLGNPYTINFHGNGGTVSNTGAADLTENVVYNTSTFAPTATMNSSDWTFQGWSKNTSATVADYNVGDELSRLTTVANASIDLYAVWKYTKDGITYPAYLVNGSFEIPVISAWTYQFNVNNNSNAVKWLTTAADNRIELARPIVNLKASNNAYGVTKASNGEQFAELNATQVSALYQIIATVPNSTINWGLDHRARGNTEEKMEVWIGNPAHVMEAVKAYKEDGSKIGTKTLAVFNTYSDLSRTPIQDDNQEWYSHTGTYTIPDGQNLTTFAFISLMTPASNSCGNLIDNAYFSKDIPKTTALVTIQGSQGGASTITSIDGTQILENASDIFSETLKYGDILSIVANEKEGYSYAGAIIDGEYIPKESIPQSYVVGDNTPASITMLYTKDLTVSLSLQGGSLSLGQQYENTLTTNQVYSLTEPSRDQYSFTGWNIAGTYATLNAGARISYEIKSGKIYLCVYETKDSSTAIYEFETTEGISLIANWEVDLSGYNPVEIYTNNAIKDSNGKLQSIDIKKTDMIISDSSTPVVYKFTSSDRNGYEFDKWIYNEVYSLAAGEEITYSVIDGIATITFPDSSLLDYRTKYNNASDEEKATMDVYYMDNAALKLTSIEAMTFYAKWITIPATAPNIETNTPLALNLQYGYIANNETLRVSAISAVNHNISFQWYKAAVDGNGNESANKELIEGATTDDYTIPTNSVRGIYNYYCKITSTNDYNQTTNTVETNHTTVTVADTMNPSLKIKLSDDKFWTSFITSAFVFNDYFTSEKTITLEAEDGTGSGIDMNNIYYYIDNSGNTETKTQTELDSIVWNKYNVTSKPVIEDDSKYVIYAKVSDNSGNTVIIDSQGFIIDVLNPTISLTDDDYTGTVTFSVTEANLKDVKIDGDIVAPDAQGLYTLVPKADIYTIKVTDNVGNELNKSIKVNFIEVTVPVINSKDYNTNNQTADITDTDLFTVTLNDGGTDVSSEGYDVKLTLKDQINHRWKQDVERNDYVVDNNNGTVTLKFYLRMIDREAPLIGHTDISYTGSDDGILADIKAGMQWTTDLEDDNSWIDVTAEQIEEGKITDLPKGTYYVRIKMDNNYRTSAVTSVSIDTIYKVPVKTDILTPVYSSSYSKVTVNAIVTKGEYEIASQSFKYRVEGAKDWKTIDTIGSPVTLNELSAGTTYELNVTAEDTYGNIATTTKKFMTLDKLKGNGKIEGKISGDDSKTYNVLLKKGSTIIKSINGLSVDDEFSFTDLLDGEYNLEVNDGEYNITYMVSVKDEENKEVGAVTVTNKQTNVEVEQGAPDVAVDKLNDLLDTTIVNESDEAQQVIDNGGNIEIKLVVSETDNHEDVQKIEDSAKKDEKVVGMIVDFKVEMIVTDKSGSKTINRISDTEKYLLIAIPLTQEAKGKTGYKAYRIHDGEKQVLNQLEKLDKNNLTKEGFYVEGDYLYVVARYFSSYALAYDEPVVEKEVEKEVDIINTGDSNTIIWIYILIVMSSAVVIVNTRKVKNR